MTAWLQARNVRKVVRDGDHETVILDDVSLDIDAHDYVALTGPSGSGKSTLLQIVGALDSDYLGDVVVDGAPLSLKSDAQLSGLRNAFFGFVFQAYNLMPHLTALQNVQLPARFSKRAPDAHRAGTLLERVGLAGKAHRRPAALSGGERQRVAIARALYMRPKLLLCDEPTGNLDRATAAGIVTLFEELAQEGVAFLIATHDEDLARSAQRRVSLAGGRLV